MQNNFTYYIYFLVLVLIINSGPLTAQSEQAPDGGPAGPIPASAISSQTQWDLLFDYDASTDSEQVVLAGAVHVDSFFWVANWNVDTIAVLANDGSFIETFALPELLDANAGFVRAMTWDGTSIWAGNNTTTIHAIDPVTKMVISSINTDSPDGIRFITYDASLDGGNGGFWVGNFNTPIYSISTTGTLLSTIAAETHTLGGMYGAAFDGVSVGGPYLWVFHQAGDPSNSLISQINLTTGIPTGVGRDVNQDLNTDGALAGGLFLTNTWDDDGTLILGGVNQTSPDRLFGYEIDFDPGEASDLATQEFSSPVSGCGLTSTEVVTFEVTNLGNDTISNIPVEILVNGAVVATEIIPGPLAGGNTISYTFTEMIDLSTVGNYQVGVRTALGGDINNANDLTTRSIANKQTIAPDFAVDFEGLEIGTVVLPNLYNQGSLLFEVNTGPTASAGTGPVMGSGGSNNYIYMETSGAFTSDVGIISTECIDLTGADDVQVGFDYHMFGGAIGNLVVTVNDQAGNESVIEIIVGQQQTSETQAWESRSLSLNDFIGSVVEVTIEGDIADNGASVFTADIALDNVLVRNCLAPTVSGVATNLINNNPGSVDLTVMGNDIYTYLWSNGATTEDLINLIPGNYSVTITASNGCAYSETYEIVDACTGYTVTAAVTDDTENNDTGAVDLTVSGGVAPYSFLWSNGAETEDISGLPGGDYTVEVTDGNGCIFTDSYFVNNLVGIQDIEGLTSLILSPNPNAGFFQIALEMEQNAEVQLSVFNTIGQVIYQTKERSLTNHTYQIDLTNQPKGIYWINLKIDGAVVTRKVTVN